MPVSGLVISVAPGSSVRDVAAAVRADGRFTVGDHHEHRLPVVLDTADGEQDKAAWQWLNELKGVAFVDVVFVHFEQSQ